MRRGYRNLLLFAGLAIVGYLLATALASSMTGSELSGEKAGGEDSSSLPSQESDPPPGAQSPAGAYPDVSPSAVTSPDDDSPDDADQKRRSYAISLFELPGLPPDAKPGTRLEIWATWKPPVTGGPKVQRLVPDALLERVSPPVALDGSPVAILSVPEEEVADLLFGDRFGALSAAIVP